MNSVYLILSHLDQLQSMGNLFFITYQSQKFSKCTFYETPNLVVQKKSKSPNKGQVFVQNNAYFQGLIQHL